MFEKKEKANSFGEIKTDFRLYFKDGKWWRDKYFGHEEPITLQIPRLEVVNLTGCDLSSFTDEEKEDIGKIGEFRHDLLEKVTMAGISCWSDLEGWCCTCYKIGINPLPALRKKFRVDVEFIDSGNQECRGAHFGEKKNFVLCNKYKDIYGEDEVNLEIRD